jgi:PAS domain S-box-containing protein
MKSKSEGAAAPSSEPWVRRLAALEIRQLEHTLREKNQKCLWHFVDRVTRRLSDADVMDVMVEEFLIELKADRVAYVVAEEDDEDWNFAVSHEAADRGVKRLPLPYLISPTESRDFHAFLKGALEQPGPAVSAWTNPVKIQPEPHFEEELREEFQAALEEEFGLARFVGCRSAMVCAVDAGEGGKALFCVQRVRGRMPWTRFQRELFQEMCRYAASLLEQTRLAGEVRDLKDQFASLVDSMPSAIVGMDLLGTVDLWNGKAAEIFGIDKAAVQGKVFWKAVPEFAFAEEGVRRILELGPEANVDFPLKPFRRKDGRKLYLKPALFSLFGSDRGEVALRIDDVTGAEELRQKLSVSQRREMQGALLEAAGHELQNLLTAVRGRMWLLDENLRGGAPQDALRDEFDAIQACTDQAGAALSRLLALSGGAPSDPEPFELRAAVEEAVALCRRTFGHSVTLLHRDEAGPTPLRASRNQVEQAVLNLLLYAQAGVRGDGYLVVRLQRCDPPDRLPAGAGWIRLRVEAKGGRDGGTAQPEASSIGWTVARALADRCGGAAEEEMADDGSQTFGLCFPLAVEAPPLGKRDLLPDSGQGEVMLVQPEASLRETALRLLRQWGYAVEAFADGAGAIRRLESGGACDLAIVDWDLPVLSGRDTASVLRAMRRCGTRSRWVWSRE